MKDQRGCITQARSRAHLATQPSGSAFQTSLSVLSRLFITQHSVVNVRTHCVWRHSDLCNRYPFETRVIKLRLQYIYQDGAYEFRDAADVLFAQLSRSLK